MRLVAFASSFDALDQYVDAFRLCESRGGSAEAICVAREPARGSAWLAASGLRGRVVVHPAGDLTPDSTRPLLAEIARNVVADDPDVFFCCEPDMLVDQVMAALLREQRYRGIIMGGQRGFGLLSTSRPGVDRLLCFGARQLARLRPEQRASAYAAGLPRLDRWRDVATASAGYGLFLAHRMPEPPVIDATLSAYEKHARVPIIVRDHPDYPGQYRFRSSLAAPGLLARLNSESLAAVLQNCSFVLATDATSILDALYLRKPVIVLPNAGLTAFDGYPGVAEGFSPAAIADAAHRLTQHPQQIEDFLEETVGGRRYDHAERVLTALDRLVRSGPLRAVERAVTTVLPRPLHGARPPVVATRVELAGFIPTGGRAAELGVAKGTFSDELLRARSDFQLASIDRWGGDRGHDNDEFADACALLAAHGERSTIVRKSFDEALDDFAPGSLDLIYIDGYAHDGQEEGRTLECWWSRLKPGGVFAGHDYHPDWRATKEAVDNFCELHGLVLQTTTADYFPSWYVRKPCREQS